MLFRSNYWDFDGNRRRGELIAATGAVDDMAGALAGMYAGGYPIRSMYLPDRFGWSRELQGADDRRSMAADNTSGFNCRRAVAAGPVHWSAHAYGVALDVNPVENPYREGGRWLPPVGSGYADRTNVRPGMAVPGGTLITAFAAVGWQWGGRWAVTPDYQHFSATGG